MRVRTIFQRYNRRHEHDESGKRRNGTAAEIGGPIKKSRPTSRHQRRHLQVILFKTSMSGLTREGPSLKTKDCVSSISGRQKLVLKLKRIFGIGAFSVRLTPRSAVFSEKY